ncbi:cytochrome P450 1A5 [Rhinatrema bivittatum]|uniref:cytochrome P450 1A5 n=1 Tax=Rhinatrema bivittatum TaxID=194408 RepID=UPI0011292547|nr:cytochrome P450 1A5 [Rhinatrema bivittatum]XP_029430342.1 cytochrome P450 1A5 [Rhinatrema bivittatum]XP_029430343.1 cytochrome P450 1A5 [Rhinatrema bivittatum]
MPSFVLSALESKISISATEILIASLVFSLLFLIVRLFKEKIPKGLKKIPGPWPFPVIGNMLELGKNPHLSLTKMSQTYGDVMQIQIGTRPVLVLSGLDTLKQALIKQGEDFLGRPHLHTFSLIGDGQTLTFSSDSGEIWKIRRSFVQNALRTFSTSPCATSTCSCLIEEHICKEAEYLVTKFLKLMEERGSFDPFRYLVVSVANVVSAMCYGRRYSHDDQELLSLVNLTNEFGKAAGSGNLVDFIPMLRYLPSQTMKAFVDVNKRFQVFVQKIVNEHYKSFDKNNIRDITDSLIDQCQEKKVDENANIQISSQKIVNLVNDVFGAGFDTITTALSWSLVYLVTLKDIQQKIHEELDQVIGRERRPRLSDRPLLPYMEAFIMEMLRHSSFVPLTIPHCTTRATSLNGYHIPKGMCIFVNQWHVNHDEKLWKDPFTFNPERFLNADRNGLNKTEAEKVVTFGLGKRKCIGENIARLEMFLFLATLLQQLEFDMKDGEKLDMSAEYGLTLKHKRCELKVRQRFLTESVE